LLEPGFGVRVKSLGSHGGVRWELRRLYLSCHLFGPVNHGQNW
jgi:hypothetical protein